MKAVIDLFGKTVVSVFEGPNPPHEDGRLVVPVNDREPESFDPALQRRVFDHHEIVGASVIRHWRAEDKTQQEIFDEHLAAGYLDAGTSIKLKTTEYATMKFTQEYVRLNAKLQRGAIAADELQIFWDFSDAQRSLPAAAYLALLERYGDFCAQLFHDYAP